MVAGHEKQFAEWGDLLQKVADRKMEMIGEVITAHNSLTENMEILLCQGSEAFDELSFRVGGAGLTWDARFINGNLTPSGLLVAGGGRGGLLG